MKRIIVSLCSLFIVSSVFSQVDLEVLVSQQSSGKPLADVKITLKNQSIGFEKTAISNDHGKVIFKAIPVRDGYSIQIPAKAGFLEEHIRDIDLQNMDNRSIQVGLIEKKNLELPVAEVKAKNTSRINTSNAEVSSQLDAREIAQLPVEARDISRTLFRLPTVNQATGFYPEAPVVSINGANALYTNYLIDDMDNNEQFLGGMKFPIPMGMAKNVTVLSNNYSAEYGLSGNGVVNVTTKSGTNNFRGEAFAITRPGPVIDGKSQFAQRDLSGNLVKNGYQRYQGGFGLGGPIKKDQTFYYVNVEHTTDFKDNLLRSPALGVNETIRGENHYTYLSGKIDHNWNEHWRFTLRVHTGLRQIDRQGGGLEGGVTFPSAAAVQDQNSFLAAWHNSYVKNNFASETNLQYSRYRWDYARPVNPGQPQVTVLDPAEQTIAVVGHPGYDFNSLENTVQFQQKFSFYLDNHTIKTGVKVMSADHSLLGGGNVNGNYTVKLSDQQINNLASSGIGTDLQPADLPGSVEVLNYNVELQPKSFGTAQNIYSLYVNDQWSVSNKLTLSVGLRWDYDNLSKGGGTTGDWNNLAPRTSFNYKLSNRTALRGGYGIFYDKIVYAIYSDALQQNSTAPDYQRQIAMLKERGVLPESTDVEAVTFDGNLTASYQNVAFLEGPQPEEVQGARNDIFSNERRILNPSGYDNPYTHQFSLGLQHQINEEMLFYVDLMHNRGENLFRLRAINAPEPYPIDPDNVQVRTVKQADATRDVPIYYDQEGNPFALDGSDTLSGIARNITMTETAGQSRYWAASFNLQKDRGDDNYAYRLMYTLSRLRNNTDDINFKAQDANRFDEEWGPSLNDRTHVIQAIYYYWPWAHFNASVASLIQSGQPVNRIPDAEKYGTTDLNGDGRAFGASYVGNSDRAPGDDRNNDRLPWSVTVDVALQYNIPVGATSRLEVRADVFNVFNAQNLSGYANNATQSNQIQVGPKSSGVLVRKNASPPRQFQFGLRYRF